MMTLPEEFIIRTRALLGESYDAFEAALQEDMPISIRINKQKEIPLPEESVPVMWCDSGYYLPERPSFTFDPLFHAGTYYVQEASSMFLDQVIRSTVTSPVTCLDLCAAPGGKSTHLLSLLPKGSLLVSNEVIRSRCNILAENIAKWGNSNCIVTNNDPEVLGNLTHLFDIIVADVPCSGEGMFRKNTDSANQWSEDNIALCAARSRRIIHDVWNALKPGGILIFSTCTYNTEEDEENIHYIAESLGAEPVNIPVKKEWQITGALKYNLPVYRFLPHKTRGEGFFLAALRKREDIITPAHLKNKGKKDKSIPAVPLEVKSWLQKSDQYSFRMRGNIAQAIPSQWQNLYQLLADRLHILSAGIDLAEIKGKDLLPTQFLAMSTALNKKAFTAVSLEYREAIKYLQKETLTLPENTPKGFILLTYNQFPIGFAKHLGNRTNNLYPQEWRIRTKQQLVNN